MSLFDRFSKKRPINFDKKILRKNDISLLIVDERWNGLFQEGEKNRNIIESENKLRELLKTQSRLINERKEITSIKKKCMDDIMKLTEEAYNNNNPTALNEMQDCQKRINDINARLKIIEYELDYIPDKINAANLQLLEETVKVVYVKMKTRRKRVQELEAEIEKLRVKLKESINEKEELNELVTGAYSYFHDLIGGEELERLDKEFL